MVPAHLPSLTLENFLQLPETKPASEYIDGQIIQKPMPQGEHSTIQRDLTHAVDNTLKPLKIARAFPELRCTVGGRSLVPDITRTKLCYHSRDHRRAVVWLVDGLERSKISDILLH